MFFMNVLLLKIIMNYYKLIDALLNDLKLSCLCSKYNIPNELRLIDKNKIENAIKDQLNRK